MLKSIVLNLTQAVPNEKSTGLLKRFNSPKVTGFPDLIQVYPF